jgi:hypothetical protein
MEARPMTRTLLLLSILLLSGCGEPEQSRVVPAGGDGPRASTVDRSGGNKASSDATIPKNIPMH